MAFPYYRRMAHVDTEAIDSSADDEGTIMNTETESTLNRT